MNKGAPQENEMLKFLKKTFLYVLAIPLLFTFLGAVSNQLVLFANHDTFPVSMNEAKIKKYDAQYGTYTLSDGTVMLDFTHCVMSKKTHLNLLADVLDFHGDIESVGDLLLGFGDWSWTFAPFVWGTLVLVKLKEEQGGDSRNS